MRKFMDPFPSLFESAETPPLTEEQSAIVHSNAQPLVVKAFAGSGKTWTLDKYARARPGKRILYVAFNKSVQQEAEKRFPRNVVSKTSHSLTFGKTYRAGRFGNKRLGNLRPMDVRKLYSLTPSQSKVVLDTLNGFMASADREFGTQHIPLVFSSRMEAASKARVVDYARDLWSKILDTSADIVVPHDAYLKLFQIENMSFGHYDIILFDEAQDANPVTTAIVMAQPGAKVFVGDSHQGIYQFRGAQDMLDKIAADKTLYLTQSFRFGRGIAHVATQLLSRLKNEQRKVIGLGKHETRFEVDFNKGYAFLARTNAALFDEAVGVMQQNKPFHFIGGVEGYRFDMILDAWALSVNRKDLIRDPYILSFESFSEMKEFGQEADDKEIKMLCRVVENYGDYIPVLVEQIKKKAERTPSEHSVRFGTAHKSKGLEFDQVVLADDFMDFFDEENQPVDAASAKVEDANIIYVAATRAMQAIQLPYDMKLWLGMD